MNSYDLFIKEVNKLRKWYYSTMYSYSKASRYITDYHAKNEFKGNSTVVYYNEIPEDKYLIERNYLAFRAHFSDSYPKFMRELILVRVISAIEVYLVESVSEIFVQNKSPFLSNNIIEIHHSELLSSDSLSTLFSKLVNKIVRDLHSGGFKEVTKYYKNTFNIDFNNFYTEINNYKYCKKDIEKYHEMRHLIVHRLGITDMAYKNKYETTDKKISISEDDFFIVLDCVCKFIDFVESQINSKVLITGISTKKIENFTASTINIDILHPEGNKFIEPKFQFMVDDKVYFLQDILLSIQYNESISMSIKGDIPTISAYMSILRKQRKKGNIDFEIIKSLKIDDSKFTKEEIELVKSKLPDRPWPKNIHKKIASDLEMSNGKSHNIISYLVENLGL